MKREELAPETKALIRAQMTRRSLLVGAGAVVGAGTLAACGTGGSTSAEGVVDVSDTEKIVRWANWPLYLDFNENSKEYPTLKAFEAATGITATYTEDIDDNNTFYGKVQGQLSIGSDIGYDVVTPTDWMASRWIEQGYAQKLNAENIPNKSNIRKVLQDVPFDSGRNYSLTWQSGFAGFGWNVEKIPAGVRTIEDLFKPANKGRIVVLSELRDTMGIILQYQGVDPSKSFTEDQYMNAIDFLKGKIADGFIRKVRGNSYSEDLVNGDAVAVIGWSGDLFILKSENDNKFDFAIPESGGTLWSDNMLIPSTSTHKKNAELLMNYYYEPAVAAQVAAYVNYICPVEAAQPELEKIDPELAASPFIFPDAATLEKVKVFRPLTADEQTNFQTAFDEAIGN
ncbi:MAG: spermidine/putrescine ABC transporter substrate-binding protein [Actinomycetales bacterium]|nr:spermidine/putrescine ABC transporter substrate-binding protein [Actinomycetales bacterium]